MKTKGTTETYRRGESGVGASGEWKEENETREKPGCLFSQVTLEIGVPSSIYG
jgi:hypothetical protein